MCTFISTIFLSFTSYLILSLTINLIRFVYVFEDGQWKISHHHSSAMPEAKKAEEAPKITTEEVSALFTRWNDALATEDPTEVAKLYSKNAVLLPTVSDRPRTDYVGIRDYFVDFLKKKPQGVIVKDNIMIGNGFAKDAGVYQVRILDLICL